MKCSRCGCENPPYAKYCSGCGMPFTPPPVVYGTFPAGNGVMPAAPKKKGSGVIIGVSLAGALMALFLVIVLASVVIRGSFGSGRQEELTAQQFRIAVLEGSGQEFWTLLPPSYQAYLQQEYDVSRETFCTDSSTYIFYRGETDFAWMGDYSNLEKDVPSEENQEAIQQRCSEYHVSAEKAAFVRLEEYGGYAPCSLRVVYTENDWYSLDAMEMAAEMCNVLYGECQTEIQDYWNARCNGDTTAYLTQIPEDFWEYISSEYALDKAGAEKKLKQYLTEEQEDMGELDTVEFIPEEDGAYWYLGEDMEIYDDMNSFGMLFQECVDISGSCQVTGEDTDSFPTYVSLTKLPEGQWIVYDYMWDVDLACQMAEQLEEPLDQLLQAYFQAESKGDPKAVGDLAPDSIWNILKEHYGMTRVQAENCQREAMRSNREENGVSLGDKYSYRVKRYREVDGQYQGLYGYVEQTPGTVYTAADLEVVVSDEDGRIRTQYEMTFYFVKTGDRWYALTAAGDFDTACTFFAEYAGGAA